MKKRSILFFVLLSALSFLSAETPRQLELRLRKSAPGLPEFRAYADIFGIVRSVRTLPAGKKAAGNFKVSTLGAYPRIGMLELSGIAVIDLEGISNFKELRYLRLSAPEIRNLDKALLPSVVRLDLSGTLLKDISWIKNFPNLRTLNLPESVTDITPLKGRKFRALSIPGVVNSDEVCRSLGISVDIRTGHAYRRPGRESLPPLMLKRDEKGRATEIAFMRFEAPRKALGGLAGEMFPEERKAPGVPPEPQEYPGLEKFSRRVPLKVSLFLKESATLKKLDLRALGAVEFSGELFPELEELYLSHAIIGLETLRAPKLKKLYLENIEGYAPGSEIPRPPFFRVRERGENEKVQFVRLGTGYDPVFLKIFPRRDEFDFSSIKGSALKSLECRYSGTSLAFLKGKKISRLLMYAPNVRGRASAVLGGLPLKELNLTLAFDADFSFLKKLKLRRLTLNGAGKSFSAVLLKKMPLESLRLRNVYSKTTLNSLRSPKLRELVLSHAGFSNAAFLGAMPQLRSLALENCVFAPAGLGPNEPDLDYVCGDLISKQILKLKHLKDLRIGCLYVLAPGSRIANIDFPWERFKALKLVNFSLYAERGDFAKEFKSLKRLKIDDISRHGISPEQIRTAALLDVLVLTNARPRPDRAVPEGRSLFRRPMIPAPRPEPGVARRVYMDAPGGFNGGFLQ